MTFIRVRPHGRVTVVCRAGLGTVALATCLATAFGAHVAARWHSHQRPRPAAPHVTAASPAEWRPDALMLPDGSAMCWPDEPGCIAKVLAALAKSPPPSASRYDWYPGEERLGELVKVKDRMPEGNRPGKRTRAVIVRP